MITTTGGDIRVDAEGEGSRGGHIIGHTKSGKPIYGRANHPSHVGFSSKEHEEAAEIHAAGRRKHYPTWMAGELNKVFKEHYSSEKYHREQAAVKSIHEEAVRGRKS